MTSKAQIAAFLALIAGTVGTVGYAVYRSRDFRSDHAQTNLAETVRGDLGDVVEDVERSTADAWEDPNALDYVFGKSQYLPMAMKLGFENEEAKIPFLTHLILPLQKIYREKIGDRAFTEYEVLQILGRDTNDLIRGKDIPKITEQEVANAIGKYKVRGKDAFDLDLEPPVYRILGDGRTVNDINDAYDEWADAVNDRWNAAEGRVEAARKGFNLAEKQFDRAHQLELARNVAYQSAQAQWNGRRSR